MNSDAEEPSRYKYILIVEAFLGTFYGSVTRNLFTPVLAYSNYELAEISIISLYTSLLHIFLILFTYAYPYYLSKGIRVKLIILWISDRVLWMLLPFTVSYKLFVLMFSLVALLISFPLGILFNLTIVSIFRYFREQYVDLGVKRSIAAYLANILGSLYVVFITFIFEAPFSYYIAYITSSIAGLVPLLLLILRYRLPESFEIPRDVSTSERAEFKAFTTITVVQGFLFAVGGSTLGLAWPIILRDLGFPLYMTMMVLFFVQNVIGALGMLLLSHLKNPRHYMIIALLNAIAPALVPYSANPLYHSLLGAMLALGYQGVSLLGLYLTSARARLIDTRYLAISGLPGVFGSLATSLFGLIFNTYVMVTLSTVFRLLSLTMLALFIPEISILGPSRVYIYELKIYETVMNIYRFIEKGIHIIAGGSKHLLNTMVRRIISRISERLKAYRRR